MRDSQRKSVYRWESGLPEWPGQVLSLDECEDLIRKIWHKFCAISEPPVIKDGRGCRRGSARNGRLQSLKGKTALELDEGKLWYAVDVPILLEYIDQLEKICGDSSKEKFAIPEISNSALEQRADIVKPLIRKDDKLYFIKPCDLKTAFTWDPKLKKRARNLIPHRVIRTLHTYAYYGMFKPSIAEVLSQITDEDIQGGVVAFEVNGPKTANDLNKYREELNAGFQVAETILYKENGHD